MVHLIDEWLHGVRDTLVVVNPADFRIHLTFNVDLDLKAMAMHLAAFMVAGQAGQSVSRFEAEVLDDSCAHDS